MPLKKSFGNMYPWVTHTHSHLGGRCPHECIYCYIDNPRFGRPPKYQGELRLIEQEFHIKYDEKTLTKDGGKYPGVVFIENCNDLFAWDVHNDFILRILDHCKAWPENTYVFQTKNPERLIRHIEDMPPKKIIGCTIETNRDTWTLSKAPKPYSRMAYINSIHSRKFITIEPILDFDVSVLCDWVTSICPEFVNIGADSKGHNLPEPPKWKIEALIEWLNGCGIEIREKHNLKRLMEE